MTLKIKVKYRGRWYYASSITVDRNGDISFDYLHDLEGAVDDEHIKKVKIELKTELLEKLK